MKKICWLILGILLVAILVVGCQSQAQNAKVQDAKVQDAKVSQSKFPTKPITSIVCYEAGSSSDIASRAIYQIMEKDLGHPIIVVNKPGAASAMGLREAYAAKPDGYTIAVSSSVNVLKVQGLLPYDHRDYDTLAIPSLSISVLAVPAKSQFKTLKDLIDHAKANPGKVKVSATAKGAAFWMAAKYLEKVAGVQFNIIENPGGASHVATQVGGNHTEAGIASITPLKSQIDAGNIRVLGVMADEKLTDYPHIPTMKEQGYNASFTTWQAYVAPKGLPKDVFDRLTSAFAKAAATEEYKKWAVQNGRITTPECVGEAAAKYLDGDAEIQKPILAQIKAAK